MQILINIIGSNVYKLFDFFTTRRYASAVSCCVSICPSVRLSDTRRCSTETAKHTITQRTPHDSQERKFSDAEYLSEIRTELTQWGRQMQLG